MRPAVPRRCWAAQEPAHNHDPARRVALGPAAEDEPAILALYGCRNGVLSIHDKEDKPGLYFEEYGDACDEWMSGDGVPDHVRTYMYGTLTKTVT